MWILFSIFREDGDLVSCLRRIEIGFLGEKKKYLEIFVPRGFNGWRTGDTQACQEEIEIATFTRRGLSREYE